MAHDGVESREHHHRPVQLPLAEGVVDQDAEGMMNRRLQRLFNLRLRLESCERRGLQAGVQAFLHRVQQRRLARETGVEGSDRESGAIEHTLDGEEVELLFAKLVFGSRDQPLQRLPAGLAGRPVVGGRSDIHGTDYRRRCKR